MTFRACVQIILLNVYKMYHTMLLLCDTVVNVSNECNTMQHSHHVVELQWQTRERVAGDGVTMVQRRPCFSKRHMASSSSAVCTVQEQSFSVPINTMLQECADVTTDVDTIFTRASPTKIFSTQILGSIFLAVWPYVYTYAVFASLPSVPQAKESLQLGSCDASGCQA